MNNKDRQHTKATDKWLKDKGINVAHIYAGTTELFQATKLATTTLRDYGVRLAHNQAQTLNNFLQATRNYKKRQSITQGQCFTVMNITKQAQRRYAKQTKAR